MGFTDDLKWRILSQTSTEESGKKNKILIFPTGLQVHIEDMFWYYKLFAEILSWAEQSGTQFFRRSNSLVVSSLCAAICFQLFDIWWSSLDKTNDFQAISRIAFYRYEQIIFFNYFLVCYYISKHMKKKFRI